MKKIFLFFTLFVFAFLLSCDSKDNDDSKSTNFLKAIINGTEVVFDTFAVEKTDYPDDGYSDIQVTATKSSDPSKKIILEMEYLATGTEPCFEFQYVDEDKYYIINPRENISLVIDVTENATNKLKGTFSGSVAEYEGPGSVEISAGSFDIVYQIK
jgi:hypothetical protein